MLKLYCADISTAPESAADLPLSQYRLAKLERTTMPEARRRSIAAELLLNYSVQMVIPDAAIPLDIACADDGKPYLTGRSLCFNLSHSGEYALCGVSDRDVGADIQENVKCNMALAKRFYTSDEQDALITADDPDYEFTRLWTLKESFIKATGRGIRQSLNSFSVISGVGTEGWHFVHGTVGGYHMAVCTRENIDFFNVETVKL